MDLDPSQKVARLQALKELRRNPAWETLFAPRLRTAHTEHLTGLANLNSTAEQRNGHLWAYHLARELDGMIDREIVRYEQEVRNLSPDQKTGF